MQTFLNTYFASCNGFSGFRSYYSEIFNAKKYDYLVILKGGPGSGKSTFMKSLFRKFNGSFSVDRIFCSSDINSLDGVIIKSKTRSVAVIDGTAPHVQDPKFPGAVDEILNLGEFWRADDLRKNREKIISLCETKSHHYEMGYNALRKIKQEFNFPVYTEYDEDFANLFLGRKKAFKVISSFSKDGFYRTESEKFWDKAISVNADIFTASSFIKNRIFEDDIEDLVLFISPFDENIIEGYYNEKNGVIVIADFEPAEEKIELESKVSTVDFKNRLSEAKEEFNLASLAHFALESIYTDKMDFARMNTALSDVIKNIESVLYN